MYIVSYLAECGACSDEEGNGSQRQEWAVVAGTAGTFQLETQNSEEFSITFGN